MSKKDNTRENEKLLAIYTFDMAKISRDMQEAVDYTALAKLYDESAKIIRKFVLDMKRLEDGNK